MEPHVKNLSMWFYACPFIVPQKKSMRHIEEVDFRADRFESYPTLVEVFFGSTHDGHTHRMGIRDPLEQKSTCLH